MRNTNQKQNYLGLIAAVCVLIFATSPRANANLTYTELADELHQHSLLLASLPHAWATQARNHIEFIKIKLGTASMSLNPSIENTHLKHACHSYAQLKLSMSSLEQDDYDSAELIIQLLDSLSSHQQMLGCTVE